jgi:K+-transporting ATPase KdpF subunit
MKASILLLFIQPLAKDISAGYIIGAVIALFILGYLLYSLIRPEKF